MNRPTIPLLALLTLSLAGGPLLAACGGSSNQGTDAAADQGTPPDDAGTQDVGTPNDRATDTLPGDVLPGDDGGQDAGTDGGSWPPPPPYHTGTSGATVQCTLPACDTNGAVTVDLSGTWTQVLTTTTTDCSAAIQAFKPQITPGHVTTNTGLSNTRAGECVYDSSNPGVVMGVIKGNVMVTCQIMPLDTGVTPVVESQMTFGDGTATGTAVTYLFDLPIVIPNHCSANYTATMTRE
jgi:hypothetical protein